MPLYEYACTKCGHRFERLQKFSDAPPSACPKCGSAVSQMLSAPAIQFKGTGWYVTDYAKRSSSPASSGSNGNGNGHNHGTETKTESKPPAPAETKTSTPASKTAESK